MARRRVPKLSVARPHSIKATAQLPPLAKAGPLTISRMPLTIETVSPAGANSVGNSRLLNGAAVYYASLRCRISIEGNACCGFLVSRQAVPQVTCAITPFVRARWLEVDRAQTRLVLSTIAACRASAPSQSVSSTFGGRQLCNRTSAVLIVFPARRTNSLHIWLVAVWGYVSRLGPAVAEEAWVWS